MATREQLEAWIERTRRTRRQLAIVVSALLALSSALWVWRKPIGGFGIAATALVAVVGWWVTTSHLNEWRARLTERDLD